MVSVEEWIELLVDWSLFLVFFIRVRVMSCQKIQRVCKRQSFTKHNYFSSLRTLLTFSNNNAFSTLHITCFRLLVDTVLSPTCVAFRHHSKLTYSHSSSILDQYNPISAWTTKSVWHYTKPTAFSKINPELHYWYWINSAWPSLRG